MAGDEARDRHKHALFWFVLAITVILSGWALKATGSFAIPIVSAFFVAIAVAPIDRRFRERLPKGLRWIGHAVSMLVLILILGAFFMGIGLAAQQIVAKFPESFSDVGEMLAEPGKSGAEEEGTPNEAPAAGEETREEEQIGPRQPAGGLVGELRGAKADIGALLKERGTAVAGTVVNRTTSFLMALVLVLFLALFLLIEAPRWREKAAALMNRREENDWVRALDRTAQSVRWFVVVKSATGFVTAALYAGWLALMGLDLIIVWAVLTFLLSFIPVIGSLVSGIVAAGYAFYQLDFQSAVVTGLGLLAIEQVMGNYVEPRFLGRQLSLSSLMVLISLLVWAWIWGAAGALLATPILILILNVSANVGSLRPLAVLLSDRGEESLREMESQAD